MANMIHARTTKGGIKFRIWSTIVNSYLTGELTAAEVEKWTREEAIRYAVAAHDREFYDRLARAIEKGTSSMLGDTRNLSGPWDKSKM